jgi:hypothetical protein
MSCEMIRACRFCLPRLGYGLPTPLYRTVLFRCWRDSLLGAELRISLMFRVPTDVECAGFLVFWKNHVWRVIRYKVRPKELVDTAEPRALERRFESEPGRSVSCPNAGCLRVVCKHDLQKRIVDADP